MYEDIHIVAVRWLILRSNRKSFVEKEKKRKKARSLGYREESGSEQKSIPRMILLRYREEKIQWFVLKTKTQQYTVASARRSGQEDFQRGTPPVSLASCSISPFFRACIITEWSTKDHETDSTGTSVLIPLLLLNFNTRLYGNPTAWYLFLATAPPKVVQA